MALLFENIIQRRLKFVFCPAFSKPVEYWNYQKQEQIHRKSWKIFILLDLTVIAVAMGVFFWTSDLVIQIFLAVFFSFCLFDLVKTIFSSSPKIWWAFLFCIATALTLVIVWLAIFINNYLILIIAFFPLNHLIALSRSIKLTTIE